MQRFLAIALASLLGFVSLASSSSSVTVQILAINDFHGNLEPPIGSVGTINGIDAGGAEFLATHLDALRQNHEHTITVSAGDLFGASPLLSAMFHDEPTIEAMNLMGLDINAVGNHEFDKGYHELLRVARGDAQFSGARFSFLAANVVVNETGTTLFPAYEIRQFGDVKIAFVGVLVHGIDLLVAKEAIEGLTFIKEADAVNALIPELETLGVHTVVVMIHEGGLPTGGINDCPGISGPIVEIANSMHDNVGVIVSGHTHQAYNCQIGNKLVTSAASNGRLVTDVELVVDVASKSMVSARALNMIVTRTVAKDRKQTELIEHYKAIAAPIAHRVVGHVREDLSRVTNSDGESLLGKVIADAQLASTKGAAEIAFVNPGGIRTDISFANSEENEGDGNVTYKETFAVQPFGNPLITMTLSGADIIDVLEQQFKGCGFEKTRMLQISKSLRYAYRRHAPMCHKIDQDSVMINDEKIDLKKSYRVVVNSFIADGGDGFAVFTRGRDRKVGKIDIEALHDYFLSRSPIDADKEARAKALD